MKLVILDEADHLTNDAQFALRRVIEKYTKNTRCVRTPSLPVSCLPPPTDSSQTKRPAHAYLPS